MSCLVVLSETVPELPAGTKIELPRLRAKSMLMLTGDQSLYRQSFLAGTPVAPTNFVIGREGELAITHMMLSRRHAELTEQGGLAIQDLHSANGTHVNGISAVAPILLKDGDFLDLGGGIVFRFFTEVPASAEALLENEAISADPTNLDAWSVWTDSLLERGEVLGEWLSKRERTVADLAGILGPLGADLSRGLVTRWNSYGFLESLQLSAYTYQATNTPWVLRNFNLVRAASFLVELQLTVSSDAELSNVLRALIVAPLPRSLRKLQIRRGQPAVGVQTTPRSSGPLLEAAGPAVLERVVRELRARCPRLDTTEMFNETEH